MIKKSKISPQERDQIALLLSSGSSIRNVAKTLGRSVSSISVEIKRNSIGGKYQSIAAQTLSKERNIKSRRLNPLKSPTIFSYICDKLRCGWSPEQISGRLKKENHGKSVLCHETIYRYIYSEQGKTKKLQEYLTRHHYQRRRWHSRYLYRRGIANRVSIRLRPEIINTKKTFGHWEGDVVEGKAHTGGIQTLLERKTRFYQAKLLPKIDSEFGVMAQKDILKPLPRLARKTVTFDNGKENYNHQKLQKWLDLKTYFCDPYCAWQKGANENTNGILRRYIPKKASLENLSRFEIDSIIKEINNKPKKCLDYATLREVFLKELKYLQTPKCSDSH